jgi:hypothetical protein
MKQYKKAEGWERNEAKSSVKGWLGTAEKREDRRKGLRENFLD